MRVADAPKHPADGAGGRVAGCLISTINGSSAIRTAKAGAATGFAAQDANREAADCLRDLIV